MASGDIKDKVFKCKLLVGNTKDALKDCPDNTFHCSVTSPPYWDQRDYNVQGQLGQEDTPEEYVESLVEICREVRRVLRADGTFWVNIGDGYCKKPIKGLGLKQKDMVGVPWLFAMAMRKDGWYLRSDIIWDKTNPMPDSTKDRPSKSHEHLFLFSKSPQYYYDWFAIAEPQKEISLRRAMSKNSVEKRKDFGDNNYAISGVNQDKTYKKMRHMISNGDVIVRNKRDVWQLSTADNTFDHFAIYPEHLVEPCILAGTSSYGCCPMCKSPWTRIDRSDEWKPSCECGEHDVQECLVLDPFNGSGTTGRVCMSKNRKYIGVDINIDYIQGARQFFIEKDFTYKELDSIRDVIG